MDYARVHDAQTGVAVRGRDLEKAYEYMLQEQQGDQSTPLRLVLLPRC
jgi:hypothetical protein